jgi:hypothetical protein
MVYHVTLTSDKYLMNFEADYGHSAPDIHQTKHCQISWLYFHPHQSVHSPFRNYSRGRIIQGWILRGRIIPGDELSVNELSSGANYLGMNYPVTGWTITLRNLINLRNKENWLTGWLGMTNFSNFHNHHMQMVGITKPLTSASFTSR